LSHRHYCDYAGHDWECDGFALRPLAGDTEPSECYCLRHQVPMEVGYHSRCPVELLACPEHREKQLQQMGISDSSIPHVSARAGSGLFSDQNGRPIVGFCLWCDKTFYTIDETNAHNASDGKGCPVFNGYKLRVANCHF